MICRRCGHENPEGANFCSSCGVGVGVVDSDATMTIQVLAVPADPGDELAAAIEELPEGLGLLVVTRGPNAGSKYLLDQEITSAGRHPDSEVFLDDVTVSRRHAQILRTEGRYFVQDVGSLNGTYVGGGRVEFQELRNGDELQIGRYQLEFFCRASESGS